MQIKCEKKGRVLIVRLKGELDLNTADSFRDTAEENLMAISSLKHLLFDFRGLDFIDSSGLGAILGRYNTIRNRGGKMAAFGIDTTLKKILDLSGIFDVLTVFPDEGAALDYLRKGEDK